MAPFIIKWPIFLHCNSWCLVSDSATAREMDFFLSVTGGKQGKEKERNVHMGQGKRKVDRAIIIVSSAVTEQIQEQTRKQQRVSDQPVGLAETEPNPTSVTDCIALVYLLQDTSSSCSPPGHLDY